MAAFLNRIWRTIFRLHSNVLQNKATRYNLNNIPGQRENYLASIFVVVVKKKRNDLRSVDDEVQVNKRRLERTKFPYHQQHRWIRSVNGANRAEHRPALNGGRRWLRRSSERPVLRHFSLRELKMSKDGEKRQRRIKTYIKIG